MAADWRTRQLLVAAAEKVVDNDGMAEAFTDLCDAVRRLERLRAGIDTWAEVEPEIRAPYPEEQAEDILLDQIDDAVDLLLDSPVLTYGWPAPPARRVEDINPTGGVL